MKKTIELLAPAGSLEDIKQYMDAGATAVLIGSSPYGMRLPNDFVLEEIEDAVKVVHEREGKIYVSVTNFVDHEILPALTQYIKQIAAYGVDGIQFGDPAVLKVVREVAPQLKLHWNAEMTSTNYSTANFWGKQGATRVVLARELNMEEITGMYPNLELEAEVQVHGMTNIYHSKRRLVRSYMSHQGREFPEGEDTSKQRGLFLVEEERPGEQFPIYEDETGTHIMSSDDICILEDLHVLMAAGIPSFRIETMLKPQSYNVVVIAAYRKAMDCYFNDPDNYEFNEAWLDEIRNVQDPHRELSFGFFYKEQVY
ncbi:putative protease [Paenibacillus turicensis]|uniref:Protease n=1 Tax=Paenibacillus turicensis TaxID=160487 RepID=A0ABS4FQH6_9BACL|nr:peptidase U32 family protein [Paenibacillus turicensis]MBP1904836.1 putative protease [Paenibacillus turicensis]